MVLGAVLAAVVWVSAALAAPLLKDGDRMVFLGDSITEQRIHTRFVMNYFALRYPAMKVSFRNAGWSGDRSPGALGRLQRDVLSLKPTVVSICFGMNDGNYTVFDQGTFDVYMKGMTGLVSELKKANVQVVLLTPGCVDPDKRQNGDVYNATLTKFAAGVKELAAKEKLPVFDINALMLDVQAKAKKDNPQFSMIPDSVHPNDLGQLVMAYGLLKALGCAEQASGVVIDAAGGKAEADRCTVADLKASDEAVSFTRTDAALPTWFSPQAIPVLKYLPLNEELNKYQFAATGLKAGKWKLAVEGTEVGTFTEADLAKGVNLATMAGPWQTLGAQVNQLSAEQENLYFSRWRQLSLTAVPPEAKAEMDALLKKMDDLVADREAQRAKAVAGDHAWKWTLTLVK